MVTNFVLYFCTWCLVCICDRIVSVSEIFLLTFASRRAIVYIERGSRKRKNDRVAFHESVAIYLKLQNVNKMT